MKPKSSVSDARASNCPFIWVAAVLTCARHAQQKTRNAGGVMIMKGSLFNDGYILLNLI